MSANGRRVGITGIGAITPIGIGVEGLWSGLLGLKSAVGPIRRFDPEPFKSRIAAEVNDFVPSDFIEQRRVRRLDRFSQFSIAATRLALEDAEVQTTREDPDRAGVMMGTALGGIAFAEAQHQHYVEDGLRGVDPG